MPVISIISTKGGVGKTTTAANLGGFAADAGLRVLLIDLDVQPTLSSYYPLAHRAPRGSTNCLPSTSVIPPGCFHGRMSTGSTWCCPTTTRGS